MRVGIVGLGRMGFNMVARLAHQGHVVATTTRDRVKLAPLAQEPNVSGGTTIEDRVSQLEPPRAVWMMVTAGDAIDETIEQVVALLAPGDCEVDAGNSCYRDSIRHGREWAARGIDLMDKGASDGIWDLRNGYLLVGPVGAGHFVEMIHNGTEYGRMQAISEGFEILETSRFDFDLAKIAHLWNQASVVRSWLGELAFAYDPRLGRLRGDVENSGEGHWTILEAIDRDVPAPVNTLSLLQQIRSREDESFSAMAVGALRNEFGGHAVREAAA